MFTALKIAHAWLRLIHHLTLYIMSAFPALRGAFRPRWLKRVRCGDAAPWRSLQEAFLDEVRLNHIFEGIAGFGQSRRHSLDAHRPAAKHFAQRRVE